MELGFFLGGEVNIVYNPFFFNNRVTNIIFVEHRLVGTLRGLHACRSTRDAAQTF